MRKIKLYIASSLNGKIAKPDGNVEWLDKIENPDKNDYGYSTFYDSIDTTIQGYNTYKQIMDWGIEFPYKGKKNYVLTRKQDVKNTDDVEFINNDHISRIKKLKEQEGKDIWLIGGGQINTMLLNENLIDELHIFIMPIILEAGIEIFEEIPQEKYLKLIESKTYESGVTEMKYEIINK